MWSTISIENLNLNYKNPNIKDGNLLPDDLIKNYYERIFKLLSQGQNIQDDSIQQELNRLLKFNGKIPKEIQDLVDGSDTPNTSLFE